MNHLGKIVAARWAKQIGLVVGCNDYFGRPNYIVEWFAPRAGRHLLLKSGESENSIKPLLDEWERLCANGGVW